MTIGLNGAQGELILDEKYYQDSMKKSAKSAIKDMQKSSLFDGDGMNCYVDRMSNAAERLAKGGGYQIYMDHDGNGTMEEVGIAEAVASSFDSELDLYIMEKVKEVKAKYGSCSLGYLGEEALAELKSYGIVVEALGSEDKFNNRTYAFSLVDENGNVLQDANGKKGSFIFSDCLIPDGSAQGAEFNFSSILDQMGYDCMSKADFIGRESEYYDMIKQVEANVQAGKYSAEEGTEALYGKKRDVRLALKSLWGGRYNTSVKGDGSDSSTSNVNNEDAKKAEAERIKQEREKYEKDLIDDKIADYKAEHDGEEPDGSDLSKIYNDAKTEAELKYPLPVGIL